MRYTTKYGLIFLIKQTCYHLRIDNRRVKGEEFPSNINSPLPQHPDFNYIPFEGGGSVVVDSSFTVVPIACQRFVLDPCFAMHYLVSQARIQKDWSEGVQL